MLSEKEIDQIAQLVLQELAGAPPERRRWRRPR